MVEIISFQLSAKQDLRADQLAEGSGCILCLIFFFHCLKPEEIGVSGIGVKKYDGGRILGQILQRDSHVIVSQMEVRRQKKFVARLRLSIQLVMSSFVCATLIEAVMRALEVDSAHEGYIWLGVAVQGLKQHRRWNDDGVTIYATEGQQTQRFPSYTQSYLQLPSHQYG